MRELIIVNESRINCIALAIIDYFDFDMEDSKIRDYSTPLKIYKRIFGTISNCCKLDPRVNDGNKYYSIISKTCNTEYLFSIDLKEHIELIKKLSILIFEEKNISFKNLSLFYNYVDTDLYYKYVLCRKSFECVKKVSSLLKKDENHSLVNFYIMLNYFNKINENLKESDIENYWPSDIKKFIYNEQKRMSMKSFYSYDKYHCFYPSCNKKEEIRTCLFLCIDESKYYVGNMKTPIVEFNLFKNKFDYISSIDYSLKTYDSYYHFKENNIDINWESIFEDPSKINPCRNLHSVFGEFN